MKAKLKINLSAVIIFLVVLFAISSCEKPENGNPNCGHHFEWVRPHNLKPIDWENYNDVFTIYRTYQGRCGCEEHLFRDTGRNIRITGLLNRSWVSGGWSHPTEFLLQDTNGDLPSGQSVRIRVKDTDDTDFREALGAKFATARTNSKWFVSGKLHLVRYTHIPLPSDASQAFWIELWIIISSIDDIYSD
jgi:hypothetical protein